MLQGAGDLCHQGESVTGYGNLQDGPMPSSARRLNHPVKINTALDEITYFLFAQDSGQLESRMARIQGETAVGQSLDCKPVATDKCDSGIYEQSAR